MSIWEKKSTVRVILSHGRSSVFTWALVYVHQVKINTMAGREVEITSIDILLIPYILASQDDGLTDLPPTFLATRAIHLGLNFCLKAPLPPLYSCFPPDPVHSFRSARKPTAPLLSMSQQQRCSVQMNDLIRRPLGARTRPSRPSRSERRSLRWSVDPASWRTGPSTRRRDFVGRSSRYLQGFCPWSTKKWSAHNRGARSDLNIPLGTRSKSRGGCRSRYKCRQYNSGTRWSLWPPV